MSQYHENNPHPNSLWGREDTQAEVKRLREINGQLRDALQLALDTPKRWSVSVERTERIVSIIRNALAAADRAARSTGKSGT